MAIKTGTTTVITDARELTNIASAAGVYDSFHPLAETITTVVDMDKPVMTVALSQNTSFTASNLATGRTSVLLLDTGSAGYTPSFSSAFKWPNDTEPSWSGTRYWQIGLTAWDNATIRVIATGYAGVGSLSSLAGTTTTEIVRSPDDGGGSNLNGLTSGGLASNYATQSVTCDSHVEYKVYLSGTKAITLTASDEGTDMTGNLAGNTFAACTAFPPGYSSNPSTSWKDNTDTTTNDYSSGVTEWLESWDAPDGEGVYFVTYTLRRGGVTKYNTIIYPSNPYVASDGYSYTRGTQVSTSGQIQGVGAGSAIYRLTYTPPATVMYKFTATNNVTGIRAVWNCVTASNAAGEALALRTFNGGAAGVGTTDSGWKTTSGDMSTGITLTINHPGPTAYDEETHAYVTIGTLSIYGRDASSTDTLLKEVRIQNFTSAESTGSP